MEEPLRKLNRCGSRNLGILKPEAGEELLQGISPEEIAQMEDTMNRILERFVKKAKGE